MIQGPVPAVSRSLRPNERIRRRPEFQRVHEHGTRTSGRYMTVLFLANGLSRDRIGIIASRRIGGAVQRNRAKRLIREVFRRNKQLPAGYDVVVIAKPGLLDAEISDIQSDFNSIRQRHAKRTRA